MSYALINRTKENVSLSGHSFILGREQQRRDMRAALHGLQHRLRPCHNGPSHNGPSVVQAVGTISPVPSKEGRIRRKLLRNFSLFLRHFYFLRVTVIAAK